MRNMTASTSITCAGISPHDRPAHPLRFLDTFTPATAREWLEKLDWRNPWLESNRVMFVLAGLIY